MKRYIGYLVPSAVVTSRQASTGFALWLLGLSSTLLLLFFCHGQDPDGEALSQDWFDLYCLELIVIWLLYPSGSLLLAVDSRRLRIPAAVWHAFSGIPMFAAISILPMAIIYSSYGITLQTSIPLLTLSCLGGLLWAWAPRWLSMTIALSPVLFDAMRLGQQLPSIDSQPGQSLLLLLLLIMLSASIGLVIYYLRKGIPRTGIRSPLIMQSAHQANMFNARHQLMQTSRWLQPLADLQQSGPGQVQASLRVLLGGIFLPMRTPYYLKLGIWLGLLPCLILLLTWLSQAGPHSLAAIVQQHAVSRSLLGYALTLSIMLPLASGLLPLLTIHQRWQRPSHELAVLNLLPGLGNEDDRRQALLQMVLTSRLAKLGLALSLAYALSIIVWPQYVMLAGLNILLLITGYSAGIAATGYRLSRRQPLSIHYILALATLTIGMTGLNIVSWKQLLQHPHGLIDAWQTYPLLSVDIFCQVALSCGLLSMAWFYWRRIRAQLGLFRPC